MTESNNELTPKETKESKLPELTEQNYTFLKYIEKGESVKNAYKLAGYQGTGENEPYKFYSRLKKRLELVYEADNVDSLRLKIAAKKILDRPIEDKPVKPEVHLRAIETLSKLTEKEKKDVKSISPFVVFKADNVEITKNDLKDINKPDIIDVEEDNDTPDNAA